MSEQEIPLLTERRIPFVAFNRLDRAAKPLSAVVIIAVIGLMLLFVGGEDDSVEADKKEAVGYGTGFESKPDVQPDQTVSRPFYTTVEEERAFLQGNRTVEPTRTAAPKVLDELDDLHGLGNEGAIGFTQSTSSTQGKHVNGYDRHGSSGDGYSGNGGDSGSYNGVDPAMQGGGLGPIDPEREEELRKASPILFGGKSARRSEAPPPSGYSTDASMAMVQQQMAMQKNLLSTMGAQDNGPTNPNLRFAEQQTREFVETARAMPTGNTDYRIAQGKIITATLETGINTTLPGQVRATVSYPVYAETGRNVLLPRGSRLIGVYNSDVSNGQARVYVIWQRAIRPDGIDIELGSPGIDGLGRAGIGGEVDKHFLERFSNAALLSLLGAGVSNVSPGEGGTASEAYKQRLALAFQNQASTDLNESAKIQPTNYIDQGSLIKVFCSRDLDFHGALANADLDS